MTNQFKNQLEKLKKEKKLFLVLIFVLAAIVVWVLVSILITKKTTGITPEMKKMAEPLNPNLNTSLLDRLDKKKSFNQSQLESFPIYVLVQDSESEIFSIIDVVSQQGVIDRDLEEDEGTEEVELIEEAQD